jgi:hypothetical protein
MPRLTRAKASQIRQAEQATYPAWKAEASEELQHQHDIAATAIPERVWTSLYVQRFNPQAAANRAEIYFRNVRPAGELWRKNKEVNARQTDTGQTKPPAMLLHCGLPRL